MQTISEDPLKPNSGGDAQPAAHPPTYSHADCVEMIKKLKASLERSIFGQKELIDEVLACLLAHGHILMTGAPGLAKTTLVRVMSQHLGLSFGRVQFTPDLLPSDITGSDVLDVEPESGKRRFSFVRGPIFAHLLLADEINRASPRTQSALLEAMQEGSVTFGGQTFALPRPFMVFATQNPFESEGTFALPEAQLDRFLMHALVNYPDETAELELLNTHVLGQLVGEKSSPSSKEQSSAEDYRPLTEQDVHALIQCTAAITLRPELVLGISRLVRSTRPGDDSCPMDFKESIYFGAGPRAGISLVSAARAICLLEGCEEVSWKHIKRAAIPVLRHRLRLSTRAERAFGGVDGLLRQLIQACEDQQEHRVKGLV